MTIKQLRQKGYKVRVTYIRNFLVVINGKSQQVLLSRQEAEQALPYDWKHFLQHKGGKVKVEIRTPEGREVWGESVTHKNDVFNKRVGRDLALARAYDESLSPIINEHTELA